MSGIPESAFERAAKLAMAEPSSVGSFTAYTAGQLRDISIGRAFARYITEHEKEPDLLDEAREVLAREAEANGRPVVAQNIRGGAWDGHGRVEDVLAGLRRGIELAKEGAA